MAGKEALLKVPGIKYKLQSINQDEKVIHITMSRHLSL